MKGLPVVEPKAGFSKVRRRRPILAAPAFVACCMAMFCLIPTALVAATLDGGFDVSVTRGGVEARVVEAGLGGQMELFYFDSLDDPEVLVKVLDGCALNGHRWVQVAAATDRPLDVSVRHSPTGSVWQARFVAGHQSLSLHDVAAFSCVSTSVATAAESGSAESSKRGEPEYVAGSATLHNRFLTEVTVTADGSDHGGVARWQSQSAGLFYFFTFDNPEVLFRVVDGCLVNGHW